MTLSDVIREVGEISVRSARLDSDLKNWVNRVQRQIADRRSFSFMHSIQSVTILAGATSANLSARFKELAPEQSPISYTAPNQSFPTPVRVRSRAEMERTIPSGAGIIANPSAYYTPYTVFIEQNDGGVWTINTPATYPNTTNATYAVSCYLYPADLALGTDHNGITDDGDLCQALVDAARAIAYLAEDPTDARGIAAKQLSEDNLKKAIYRDARQRVAGRSVRM